MTEQPKKLSRRDAIKVLGAAAGASVLATLPTKWTKPEITAGVLPAHAQTSWPYSFAACTASGNVNSTPSGQVYALIAPAVAGVSLKLAVANNIGPVLLAVDPSGTYPTDGSGRANSSTYQFVGNTGDILTLEWTFVGNPSAPSCQTTFTWL